MVSLFLLLGCNLSYIVDLLAALHELASASARTSLKLASSVRVLLKPLWRHLNWYIIETSSGLLRKSSVIFWNFRKMFGNVRLAFATISENLRKFSERGRKSSENHQKRRHQYVNMHVIKRTLHVSSKIWILCSRAKNNISLVRWAHSWDSVLTTRT